MGRRPIEPTPEVQAMMVAAPNDEDLDGEVTINWSRKDVGCGAIKVFKQDGKIICDSGGMGRHFVKSVVSCLVERMEFVE